MNTVVLLLLIFVFSDPNHKPEAHVAFMPSTEACAATGKTIETQYSSNPELKTFRWACMVVQDSK